MSEMSHQQLVAELDKAIAISIAMKVESKGDWFAYWLGRLEAYEEAKALVTGDQKARLIHTVVTPNNLKLAKKLLNV